MARRSPRARAMLRTYRDATAPRAEERDELWDRIEGSLNAGTPPPAIGTGATATAPWLAAGATIALVAAAAAAVILLGPWGSATTSKPAPRDQAPHGVVEPAPRAIAPPSSPRDEIIDPSLPPAIHQAPPLLESNDRPRSSPKSGPRIGPHRMNEAPSNPLVDELQAELTLVRKARQALQADRPARALEVLDAHARAFPNGQMREDRMVLRIEALCAAGKGPQARAEAHLFLRAFPGSAHGQRVRDACVAP